MSHYYTIAAGVAAMLIQAVPLDAIAATTDTAKSPAKVELVAGTSLKRVTLTRASLFQIL